MNQAEIIALARECGSVEPLDAPLEADFVFTTIQLERFANAIAAKEREACALICDSLAHQANEWDPGTDESAWRQTADLIRARDTTEGEL